MEIMLLEKNREYQGMSFITKKMLQINKDYWRMNK